MRLTKSQEKEIKSILFLINHWVWHKCKPYRDFLYWNWKRKHKNWCKFAYKHKLYVNVTDNYIKQYYDI